MLTLAMRPLGALVFGRLAERHGRRPVPMADGLLFSAFELASAFARECGTASARRRAGRHPPAGAIARRASASWRLPAAATAA